MQRTRFIVLACALALMVGCTNNNNHKSDKQMAAAKMKSQSQSKSQATEWANSTNSTSWSASVAHPLAGAWQLAAPRHRMRDATITATDPTHLTLSAGKNCLSGDYLQQGSFLLILTNDEHLRPIAWKVNSDDSLTLVRGPISGGAGASRVLGTTLLRAPDSDAAAEANMDDLFAE